MAVQARSKGAPDSRFAIRTDSASGVWWDGHWIRDRVARKLGGAFRFED